MPEGVSGGSVDAQGRVDRERKGRLHLAAGGPGSRPVGGGAGEVLRAGTHELREAHAGPHERFVRRSRWSRSVPQAEESPRHSVELFALRGGAAQGVGVSPAEPWRVPTVDVEAELTLVGRLRDGDAFALEKLMERYAARVYRLRYAITRNGGDTEEVVQDVFLNVFRKINAFEGRAALGTWLYRVAMNAALNKRRGKQAGVEGPLEDCLPPVRAGGPPGGGHTFPPPGRSPAPPGGLLPPG